MTLTTARPDPEHAPAGEPPADLAVWFRDGREAFAEKGAAGAKGRAA